MAKKQRAKKAGATQASNSGINESALTKGEVRKLNALRKSIGDKLGEEAFAKWLKKRQSTRTNVDEDRNATLIADALIKLIEEKNLRIPRGGYLVTRGRGRLIVEQPAKA